MDQRVQRALRRALGEMMQQFGDLTGEIPPCSGRGRQAMRESGQDWRGRRQRRRRASEQKAIEALQKGAREMGRTLAQQFGRGRQGGERRRRRQFGAEGADGHDDARMAAARGRAVRRCRRRPTARIRAAATLWAGPTRAAALDTGDVVVPEEAERKRSQAIQEELRRRGAERERPQRGTGLHRPVVEAVLRRRRTRLGAFTARGFAVSGRRWTRSSAG